MRDKNICFFGNPWASAEIRGKQVAERGGFLYEPEQVRPDDILVFIKCLPGEPLLSMLVKSNAKMFIDVVDCYGVVSAVQQIPNAVAIGMSRIACNYINDKINNKVVFVQEHHCNFDNIVKDTKEIKRAGFIGYAENFQLDIPSVTKELADRDIEFVYKTDFANRQEVVDFYMSIDLQICFRIPGTIQYIVPQLKNPLKLANAGSFGIPSIAYPELSYVDEWDGAFFPIASIDGLVAHIDNMRENMDIYNVMKENAISRAQKYHIDITVKQYKEILDGRINYI